MSHEPPVLIVCNRHSGRGAGWERAAAVARALEARSTSSVVRETTLDGATFADVTPDAYRAVVVVGGDGSLHAAVNELPTFTLPVAFLGTGTVNVISLERGLPVDPDAVAELVARGRTAHIPLLEGNGRRFVLFAEAGWLGSVVGRVNRWRAGAGKHGKAEFTRFGAVGLASSWGKPLSVRVRTTTGEERTGRFSNALVTRARVYGGSLKIPLAAANALEERSFTFVGERTGNPLGHGLYLASAGAGQLGRLRGRLVEWCAADEVLVEGPESVGVHMDAESEGAQFRLPLSIRASNETLRLLIP